MAQSTYAKTIKPRFWLGDLDLSERRTRFTSSGVQEEEGARGCPCGDSDQSRIHMVGAREVYKEERNVFEDGMRKADGCDMEEILVRWIVARK